MEIVKQKLQTLDITAETCQKDGEKNNLVIKRLAIDTNKNEGIREMIQNFQNQKLKIDTKIYS